MKHALLVIFLAGCPDTADDTTTPPPVFDPHDQCIGFGVTFSAQPYADAYYFGYAHDWGGASGSDVKPIAVGGIEYVSVYGPPYIDQMTPAFVPWVNGPALGIDMSHPPTLSAALVLGMGEGTADLCIYDHGSTTLHDGTRMIARTVRSMVALPAADYYQPFERQPSGTTYPFADWRMFIGKRRTIAIGLLGTDNWRLVDQGMTVDLAVDDADFTPGTREHWDSVSRDVDHATTMRIRATQHNGDAWQASVGFVDHVDHLAMLPSPYDTLQAMRVNSGWRLACFTATIDGAMVLAAPYEVGATPQVIVHPDTQPSNCVYLEPVEAGSGALSVVVGNTALEVPFTVTE